MPNFQTYEHCESNIIYENKKNHLINFFQKLVDDMSEYEVCHISGRDAMMDIFIECGRWQRQICQQQTSWQRQNNELI